MIIESGSDLLLILNLTDEKGNRIRVNTKSSFTIRVFTTDRKKYLEYSKSDVVTSNDYDKLYINSNELEVLESGVITYTYMYGVGDKNFNDGEYNNQKTVYTDYYFKNISNSAAPSNPVNYKVIEEIKDSIKQETDRAKEAESKIVQDTANKYQAKEVGKGLSTNDYTTAEKNKLASLPDDFEGACTDAEINAMVKELGL